MKFYGIDVPDSSEDLSPEELEAWHDILAFLRPKPSPFPLLRIGGQGDGAYLLPDDLEGIAACFSPGVNNFKNFEDELLSRYDIASHMCDFSSDLALFRTPLVAGRQTFIKKWLDVPGAADAISLGDWIAEKAPTGDLLLQMDIEGAEYRNLLATDPQYLRRFRVMVFELHRLEAFNSAPIFRAVLRPFFERLAQDFICIHVHPNNVAAPVSLKHAPLRIPQLLEITLLRKDRFEACPPETRIAPDLPHPLDVQRNVLRRPPLFMDEAWLDQPLSTANRMRRLEIELACLREDVKRAERDIDPHFKSSAAELTKLLAMLAAPPHAAPGGEDPDPPLGVDIAQGKPFTLSSAYGGRPAQGRVAQAEPFFFHTDFQAGARITIDLETPSRIEGLRITNRAGLTHERARALFVIFHDQPDPTGGRAFAITSNAAFLSGADRQTSLRIPDVQARYVSVISPLRTALHFSNLEVFGLAG